MKKKMNTMSNICYKGNSRKAIMSLVVTTFTAFVSTLSCISASLKKPQQKALDYFSTLIKTELANFDKGFQNQVCFISTFAE